MTILPNLLEVDLLPEMMEVDHTLGIPEIEDTLVEQTTTGTDRFLEDLMDPTGSMIKGLTEIAMILVSVRDLLLGIETLATIVANQATGRTTAGTIQPMQIDSPIKSNFREIPVIVVIAREIAQIVVIVPSMTVIPAVTIPRLLNHLTVLIAQAINRLLILVTRSLLNLRKLESPLDQKPHTLEGNLLVLPRIIAFLKNYSRNASVKVLVPIVANSTTIGKIVRK